MGGGFDPFRRLADLEAIEQTPLADRLDAPDVHGCLKTAAARHGDRTAIIDLADPADPEAARCWTYAEAFEAIMRTANALWAIGGGRPVAYMLPNLAETHFTLWGAAAGAGAAPVNPMLSAEVVAEIVEAAGAGALVTTAPGTELYDKAQAVRRHLSSPMAIIPLSGDDDALDALAASAPGEALQFDPGADPDRPAAYFHTGGTTGAPKLACQTQMNQAAMSWMLRFALDLGADDVALTGLPLFHANAAHLTGLAPLTAGSTLLLAGPDGFRNKALLANFWRIVERYGVTMFSGVPTIYASLLDHPVGEADVSSLRYGVVGAAPMPVSVFKAFEERTGITILELYGMTESTCVSTCNPRDGERRVGSIGLRMPYHDVKVAVVDEAGAFERDAEPGETGVLALKGVTVISGYKQAERNAGLFLPDGWLNSGDLARQDADGYFWLTGRAKDLIIRGGHNIDPGMIEDALHAHPDVELAAAIGQPDAYAGEVPVAYVVLRDGATVDEAALLEHARAHVAERPAAPKAVRVIETMPVTAVGKIFKPALREDAAIRAARAVLENAGIRDVELSAHTEKARGLVVTARLPDKENERAVSDALAEFSFQVEIAAD
ncbi:acyl-CoA synthetase [Marinicauda salina]|uniref:Acyl-CoA synthetase n=1 Tax=Marinicauda salina TaxID=2135793 RepID=A0A2U2BV80_9PROT|nr:acyl-CoA synthetase [Marinicauda salina]PWE17925.1 acyl-CoA synthetase [Marinicauda salina]